MVDELLNVLDAGVALCRDVLAGRDELTRSPLLADDASVVLDVRHGRCRVGELSEVRSAAHLSEPVAITKPG
jgi:hypothetical protein